MKSNDHPTSTLLDSIGVLNFCRSICTEDSVPYLVAIARKMPRLLEFAGVLGSTSSTIVTERALPWIKDIGKPRRMRITDDVMNVGTTILNYLSYARQEFPNVVPDVRVFAARKSHAVSHQRIQHLQHPVRFKTETTFEDLPYRDFETALPLELLKVGKPYDVDFPILNLPIHSDQELARTPEDWRQFFADHFASVHNLTVPSQRNEGITSITIIDPLDLPIEDVVLFDPPRPIAPCKVRIYISRKDRMLRLAPMWISAVIARCLDGEVPPLRGVLGEIYQNFSRQARSAQPYPLEPQYNLFIFLASFALGWRVVSQLHELLLASRQEEAHLSRVDLELLFGDDIAADLQTRLSGLLAKAAPYAPVRAKLPTYTQPDRPSNPEAAEIVLRALYPAYSNAGARSVFTEAMHILDAYWHGQHPSEGSGLPPYERLRHGLSLWDIWWVLSTLSTDKATSMEELSFLLDFYIDIGAVVPVIERIGDLYIRTYRSGEAKSIPFRYFIHSLLRQHGKPIGVTQLTKILAVLAIYYPLRTPLIPVFDSYGAVPLFHTDDMLDSDLEEALEFLRRKHWIRIVEPPEAGDSGQMTFTHLK